jgi:hypothetical protein
LHAALNASNPPAMSVRAKMKVTSKSGNQVRLDAVTDEQNKTWAKYTPCGSVTMSIDNESALAQFEQGATYFVDFTPAPATEAGER